MLAKPFGCCNMRLCLQEIQVKQHCLHVLFLNCDLCGSEAQGSRPPLQSSCRRGFPPDCHHWKGHLPLSFATCALIWATVVLTQDLLVILPAQGTGCQLCKDLGGGSLPEAPAPPQVPVPDKLEECDVPARREASQQQPCRALDASASPTATQPYSGSRWLKQHLAPHPRPRPSPSAA